MYQVTSLTPLSQQSKPVRRIFINVIGQIRIIHLDDVLYFMANTNYTIIVMKDGSRLTTSKTMRIYADTIEGHPDFLRIHRSYIVNKNCVSSIIKMGKQHRLYVEMINNERLELSFTRKEEILQKLAS
jgi:two-component system, LytTR family, response regulator